MSDLVAVVEVGSGSAKLLITDTEALTTNEPDRLRLSAKTRLWSGGGRLLDPAGMRATAAAFERFASALAEAGDPPLAVVATAVARSVDDVTPLESLCLAAFDVPLEILSGDREAALAHAGAARRGDLTGPITVIDIGAGSTQVATDADAVAARRSEGAGPGADDGPDRPPIRSLSLAIGATVLTEGYLHHDPPGPDELSSALSVAELHYDDLRRELQGIDEALGAGTVLGVGAIGQIAAVEIGLTDPAASVDGYRLEKSAVEEVFRALATEPAADRAHNPGLRPEHVDDIVGALCVLVEFMRRFDVAEVIVSERDLRHGRAAELLSTK